MKNRFKNYQVDSERCGIKDVADLTEEQAKEELCDAMDLIEILCGKSFEAIEAARKARYLV